MVLRDLIIDAIESTKRNSQSCCETRFLNERLSIEEYERLTGIDFESPSEVAEDLRNLWIMMYNDQPLEP